MRDTGHPIQGWYVPRQSQVRPHRHAHRTNTVPKSSDCANLCLREYSDWFAANDMTIYTHGGRLKDVANTEDDTEENLSADFVEGGSLAGSGKEVSSGERNADRRHGVEQFTCTEPLAMSS